MSTQDAISLELAHGTLRSSVRLKYLAMIDERVAGGGDPEISIDDAERVLSHVIQEPSNAWAIQFIIAQAQLPPWVKREVIRVTTRPPTRGACVAPAESEAANA